MIAAADATTSAAIAQKTGVSSRVTSITIAVPPYPNDRSIDFVPAKDSFEPHRAQHHLGDVLAGAAQGLRRDEPGAEDAPVDAAVRWGPVHPAVGCDHQAQGIDLLQRPLHRGG